MQVRDRETLDEGKERLSVVPDTLDDLWHLQYIIEPGDLVSADTTRRIQRSDDHLRDTGGERESMWVAIAVDSVEFHRFANRLRVGGDIVGCSREDQLGFSHTLNVEIHDELTIEKRLKPDQRARLEEAVEATADPDVAVVTVEEGRATVHSVNQFGPEERTAITGPSGKGEFARDRTELFEELGQIIDRLEVDAIVLAGPGFTKQDAYDHIVESYPDVAERIRVVDTSSAGDRGVHEVLQRGVLEDVRTTQRVGREAAWMEELMERIATDEPATYGAEAVARAAEYGAVERLLVLDERLREERGGSGSWEADADDVITRVEQQGGEVLVLSNEFDPGRQLANLGGIAALLRYQID